MYKCPECGEIFEEPGYEDLCYEVEYGIASQFNDHHWYTRAFCPQCYMGINEEEDYYYEEDDDDE